MAGAIIGGAVAGALISSASYLINSSLNNTEITAGGLLGAAGLGAIVGGFGGAAGAASVTVAKIGLSAIAGIISGISAGCSFDGSIGHKIAAGLCAGLAGFGSAYLGTKIDINGLSLGAAAFATYASTLFIGVPAEIVTTSAQQGIRNAPVAKATTSASGQGPVNRYATPWAVYWE